MRVKWYWLSFHFISVATCAPLAAGTEPEIFFCGNDVLECAYYFFYIEYISISISIYLSIFLSIYMYVCMYIYIYIYTPIPWKDISFDNIFGTMNFAVLKYLFEEISR